MKPLDPGEAGGFEKVQRSADIRVVIKLRLANRRPHARPRREMRDRVEFFSMKKRVHRRAVAQIHLMNRDIGRHGLRYSRA